MVLCTYCNKEYKTKYTLKAHQKRPSCLKNKKGGETVVFLLNECTYCKKIFNSKSVLNRHLKTCSTKRLKIIDKLMNEKDIIIENKDKEIKELRSELKRLTLALASRPINNYNTTTYNDNRQINIKEYIQNTSEPMSKELLDRHAVKLTLDHVLNKGQGMGRFFCDNVLKDSTVVTTDYARRVCMYLCDTKEILKDPKLKALNIKFFASIVERAVWLINTWLADPAHAELDLRYHEQGAHILHNIRLASEGKKNAITPEFVTFVASHCVKENMCLEESRDILV